MSTIQRAGKGMQADVAADEIVDQPGAGPELYRDELDPKFVD